MNFRSFLTVFAMMFLLFTARGAEDARCFEFRVYYAAPGKLEAMHQRFREHTCALFAKHGATNIGYWVPIENPDQKLIYVLAFPSAAARETFWKLFSNDPEWQNVQKATEAQGKIVDRVESTLLTATDFSPVIQPAVGTAKRVFELRTYTTTEGNLDRLMARFRNHTLGFFSHHGMTNLFYWNLSKGQKDAERTLTYVLAHPSVEAAATAFKNFRADPAWIAAKAASEKEGGGSLTVPNGVVSVFMEATDYSPTR